MTPGLYLAVGGVFVGGVLVGFWFGTHLAQRYWTSYYKVRRS